MRQKRLRITAGLVGLLLAAACGGYLELRGFAHRPSGPAGPDQVLVVEPGQALKITAEELQQRGLVSSGFEFRLLARIWGYDRRLKAGEYGLNAALTPLEILDRMEKGLVRLHRLTIPEGYSLRQIAQEVEKAGLGRAADILGRAMDPAYARACGIDAATLEGYLFPDTYFFPKTITTEGILAAMLQRFHSVFTPDWERRAAELGLSVHAVVTLASLIEKETGQPSERPLISAVFHNRLRRGMRLETDPAVIYGIRDFDGNLTRRQLETPGPYNTYLNRGLPPGPIASPGRESLHAALYPAARDFLFFVAKNDGTHQFSNTLADHQHAVEYYQRGPGRFPSRSAPKHLDSTKKGRPGKLDSPPL